MSNITNKDVALSIIHFLKKSVAEKQIGEDYTESMDVAIDCIADAFEVEKDDDSKVVSAKFNGLSLAELLNGSSSISVSESIEIDEETKEKADLLKVEGNRAMASRNFEEAIAKYTEAIKLDSTNVVYLSNRAAAYSSSQQHDKAIEDAKQAIKLNSEFSKSYSRLGLAQYALGDAKSAMESYKKGLEIEGDKKSDAMKKGYETAKKRVEDDLEKSITKPEEREATGTGSSTGSSTGGLPDLSSMFGGSGGGMPNISEMMSNPNIMQAAQQMMSDPNAMQNLLSNPAIKQMAQNFGLGGENGPDLSSIMNNPMFSQFMGGNNNNNNNNPEN